MSRPIPQASTVTLGQTATLSVGGYRHESALRLVLGDGGGRRRIRFSSTTLEHHLHSVRKRHRSGPGSPPTAERPSDSTAATVDVCTPAGHFHAAYGQNHSVRQRARRSPLPQAARVSRTSGIKGPEHRFVASDPGTRLVASYTTPNIDERYTLLGCRHEQETVCSTNSAEARLAQICVPPLGRAFSRNRQTLPRARTVTLSVPAGAATYAWV